MKLIQALIVALGLAFATQGSAQTPGGFTGTSTGNFAPLSAAALNAAFAAKQDCCVSSTGVFTSLSASGAVLFGTGTPQGTPYQFQTAYNADPSVGPVDTRQNMFNTTLSYATTSTHIWENMNSFVQVNGPGTASGEINVAHTFLGISAGANVAVAEGYESSATNSGIIGSFANYLGLTNNFVGGTAGAIHGMNLYLNNLNTTPGAIGEWAGINIGPMVGGGALPTFYSAIRIPDANAGIVTLGGILVGNLGNAVPGQVLIQGADNSDGTFTFQARDLAGANALLIANSGRVLFQASGITIQPTTIGPNLFIQGVDSAGTTASLMVRNLATTVAFSVRNDGTLIANGNAGVTCAPGAPTASFATSGGIVTHC
jgi:hypothetical protein